MTKPKPPTNEANNPENSIHPQHGKLLEFLNYVYQSLPLYNHDADSNVLGFIFENNVLAFRTTDPYIAQHICRESQEALVNETQIGVRVMLNNRLFVTFGCPGDY